MNKSFIIIRKVLPLFAIFLTLSIIPMVNAQPEMEWNESYGAPSFNIANSVIQTSDGGYALAGLTSSDWAVPYDLWLVKTDSSGNKEWSRTFGGNGYEQACSVIQTSDGGYALAGYTESYGAGEYDFWLVKTDSQGNEEWSETYGGGNNDEAYSVIQTSDGGYALAGYTESYGAGEYDFWLVKTDSSGNKEWSRTFGGSDDDYARSITQTSDGGYALGGYCDVTSREIAGGLVKGISDFWLVKTDSQGNEEWSETYGGGNNDEAYSVIQTSDGGYALAGYTESYGAGEYDFWLVKTNSLGKEEWSRRFGGYECDYARSITQTSDGGYALGGRTGSYGAGKYDFWLVKTDSSGNKEWSRTFGGSDDDYARSITQTSDGGYALSGKTDSYELGSYGFSNFWLVKTVPNKPPSASFFYSPSSPASGETVNFSNQSSDSDGDVKSWSWDFGDGATSNQQNPSHSYSSAGDYTVTLEVTDDDGATDNITKTVSVKKYSLSTSVGSGNGSITLDPSGGAYDEGTTVTLTANPDSGYQFDHWSGDASETSTSIDVTMDSDKSITAHFTETEEKGLPLIWIGLGAGVIIALIAGIAIGKGT